MVIGGTFLQRKAKGQRRSRRRGREGQPWTSRRGTLVFVPKERVRKERVRKETLCVECSRECSRKSRFCKNSSRRIQVLECILLENLQFDKVVQPSEKVLNR